MLPRYRWIDALRGIAFLGVLIVHISTQIHGLPFSVVQITNQGARGVQLFFIISALTLFHSIQIRKPKEKQWLLYFFIRRFFRIAPFFWCGIVLYILIDGLGPRLYAPTGITWKEITLTFLFLHEWWPTAINSVAPGDWSIGVEMMFYCIVPFLFSTIRSLRQAVMVTVASLPISLFLSLMTKHLGNLLWPPLFHPLIQSFVFFWLPSQLPIFFLGIVLYFILYPVSFQTKPISILKEDLKFARWLLYSALYLGIICSFGSYWHLPNHFIYGLIFVLLAWTLALNPHPLLVNQWTAYCGKVSFSGYLVHFLALRFTESYWKFDSGWNPLLILADRFILDLILTIALASLTYYGIELQGIRFGNRLISRLKKRES